MKNHILTTERTDIYVQSKELAEGIHNYYRSKSYLKINGVWEDHVLTSLVNDK